MSGFRSPRSSISRVRLVACCSIFVAVAGTGTATPGEASEGFANVVAGIARIQAPPEAVKEIKAVVTLPVRATPVAPGQAVEKGEVLVEMDLEKLEKELSLRRRELSSIQEEKRFRASNKEVQRGGGASSGRAQGPSNSVEMELVQKEANATRDLLEVQTNLSTASPRAPENGFLVKLLYGVGSEAKRRKPILTFIDAKQTLVSVTLPAESIDTFPPGSRVAVSSPADPGRRFVGTVEKPAKTAGAGILTLRPIELPFLSLEKETPVILTALP